MKEFVVTDDASFEKLKRQVSQHGDKQTMGQLIQDKLDQTRWIVEAVRKEGDKALADLRQRFDGAELEPGQFEVTHAEIEAALKTVEPG